MRVRSLLFPLLLVAPAALAGAAGPAEPEGDEGFSLSPLGLFLPGDWVEDAASCSAPALDLVSLGTETNGTWLEVRMRVRDVAAPATCAGLVEDTRMRTWRAWITLSSNDAPEPFSVSFSWSQRPFSTSYVPSVSTWGNAGWAWCDLPFESSWEDGEFRIAVPLRGEPLPWCAEPAYDLSGLTFTADGRTEASGYLHQEQVPRPYLATYVAYDDFDAWTVAT